MLALKNNIQKKLKKHKSCWIFGVSTQELHVNETKRQDSKPTINFIGSGDLKRDGIMQKVFKTLNFIKKLV